MNDEDSRLLVKRMAAFMHLPKNAARCVFICDTQNYSCEACNQRNHGILHCILNHIIMFRRLDCYVDVKNYFYNMSLEQAKIELDMNEV